MITSSWTCLSLNLIRSQIRPMYIQWNVILTLLQTIDHSPMVLFLSHYRTSIVSIVGALSRCVAACIHRNRFIHSSQLIFSNDLWLLARGLPVLNTQSSFPERARRFLWLDWRTSVLQLITVETFQAPAPGSRGFVHTRQTTQQQGQHATTRANVCLTTGTHAETQ